MDIMKFQVMSNVKIAEISTGHQRTGTDDITINGNASEEIDGVATYTLDVQYEWVILISDGANWHIIG